MPAANTVTLRRNVWARLVGGYWFQFLLSVGVITFVLLIGTVLWFGVSLQVAPFAGPLVILAFWLLGVFASARADRVAVRMRYYQTRVYAWVDIEQVTFTVRTYLGRSGEAVAYLRVGGRDHLVRPLSQCSEAARLEFGDALISFAQARGVPVAVDPREWRWAGLAGAT